MAINCDDIFNQINDLRSRRDRLADATESVSNINPDDLEPKSQEEIIRRSLEGDPEIAAGAAEDVAKQRKSNRLKDRFNNAQALANRLGDDQATSLLTLLKGMDESIKDLDPEAYARQIATYSRAELTEALNDAADTAGIDLNDGLVRAVQSNLAPFLPILRNQAKLKVYADLTRNDWLARVKDLEDLLESGNYQPGELGPIRADIVKKYLAGMTAQNARNISRTRAGQLLRNERDLLTPVDGVLDLAGIDPKPAEIKTNSKTGMVEVDPRTLEKMKAIQDDVEQMIGEKVGATPEELGKDSQLGRVVAAANEGRAGVPELKRIRQDVEAAAQLGEKAWWEADGFDYEKYARAGWKDSVLSGLKSIFQNNYASQKLVFGFEGYKAAWTGFGTQYARNIMNPVGSATWRDPLKPFYQNFAGAVRANNIAETVIKQTWAETLRTDFFRNEFPFAGNIDQINSSKGQMSIPFQWGVAQRIAAAPWKTNLGIAFQVRDKLMWGLKSFGSYHMQLQASKKGRMSSPAMTPVPPSIKGVLGGQGFLMQGDAKKMQMPVNSILQLNSTIDNRAGLRTYTTIRAMDLYGEFIKANPEATPAAALKYANSKIAEELYSARPDAREVQAYRDQFGAGSEFTDEQIRNAIVMNKVGYPVMDTPARKAAVDRSFEFRMQGNLADEVPGLNQVNRGLQQLRRSEAGDFLIPFLKSWAEQTAWDLNTGGLSMVKNIWDIADTGLIKGQQLTPEQIGHAVGSTAVTASVFTLFAGMEMLGPEAPVQLVGQPVTEEEKEALRAQGKMPNTLYIRNAPQWARSLPIGNMPIMKTLLIYKDLKTAINRGLVSDADALEMMGEVSTVLTGLLMRAPGMYQLQFLMRAFSGEADSLIDGAKDLASRFVMSSMNPLSGGTRTVGQIDSANKGTDWESLITSAKVMEAESDLLEKLPADHPFHALTTKLQNFLQAGGTPELVRLLGGRDRKYTYLGLKWNGLDFINGNDARNYPDGVQGKYVEGDNAVEAETDRLKKLNEPAVFRSHMLEGVPITPLGINDLELISGTMRSRGYADSEGNELSAKIGGGKFMTPNGAVETVEGIDIGKFIDTFVKGNTWREALNALYTSDVYRRWNSNEATSNRGSMSDADRDSKPGSRAVDFINAHYTNMLGDRFIEAGLQNPERFQGAAQYVKDRKIILPSQDEIKGQIYELRDVTEKPAAAQ